VEHLSSGLCRTESSSLIIPEALIHKLLYSNPMLSHLLWHRVRHRRWRGFERTTFKYGDRGVRYVYIEAGHASSERVSCRQNRSIIMCA